MPLRAKLCCSAPLFVITNRMHPAGTDVLSRLKPYSNIPTLTVVAVVVLSTVVVVTAGLTVSTPCALVPDHDHLNLPLEPKAILAVTVLRALTLTLLPLTAKACVFLPLFAILNRVFPAVNVFGETRAPLSLPLTATVVATTDCEPDAGSAKGVATPAAATPRSARTKRIRRMERAHGPRPGAAHGSSIAWPTASSGSSSCIPLHYAQAAWGDPWPRLARLRTDLDRFQTEEAALLSYHGYWSLHRRLMTFYPDFAVQEPTWREFAEIGLPYFLAALGWLHRTRASAMACRPPRS